MPEEERQAEVATAMTRLCVRLLEASGGVEILRVLGDAFADLGAGWYAIYDATAATVVTAGAVPRDVRHGDQRALDELASALGRPAPRDAWWRCRDGAALACLFGPPERPAAIAVAGRSAAFPDPPDGPLQALRRLVDSALRRVEHVEALRRSGRSKSELVAAMSHELRNPLSAILGYTELLIDGHLGHLAEDQSEVIRRAHHSALALHELTSAVLDISRFEGGDPPDLSAEIDAVAVLEAQIETVEESPTCSEIHLEVDAPGPAIILRSDALKLGLALRHAIEAARDANGERALTVRVAEAEGKCSIDIAPRSTGTATKRPAPSPVLATSELFPISIAKRLLRILGGTLEVFGGGDRLAVRMMIPQRAAAAAGDAEEPPRRA